jgi:hypothetical protein
MKHKYIVILTVLLLIILSVGIANAQGVYSLPRSVVSAGGGTSTGSVFTLQGSIGQPVANTALTGDNYSLSGGFWSGIALLFKLMLPLVTKN